MSVRDVPMADRIKPPESVYMGQGFLGAQELLESSIDPAYSDLDRARMVEVAKVYATLEVAAQLGRIADTQAEELATLKRDLGYA